MFGFLLSENDPERFRGVVQVTAEESAFTQGKGQRTRFVTEHERNADEAFDGSKRIIVGTFDQVFLVQLLAGSMGLSMG